MPGLIDLRGQRFGRLVVIEIAEARNNKRLWQCRCDCGKEIVTVGGNLRQGHSKSCGCLNRELQISRPTTHGMTGTPLFSVWKGMLTRCRNRNYAGFKNYGGRGIKVCDRWQEFANFKQDVGDGYSPGLTIDRINNDGDYEPGNCRWITKQQQSANRRSGNLWDLKDAPIKGNTSGIRGVSPNKRDGGWVAAICINGKQRRLGSFKTKQAAAAAYRAAAMGRKTNAKNPTVRGRVPS